MRVDGARLCQSEVVIHSIWERPMSHDHGFHSSNTIRTDLAAIFVSLELSRRNWLITSLSPGKGETMSRHSVKAVALSELLRRLADLRGKAKARTGGDFPIVVIMEAGLDGFWLYRALVGEGVESHVVDAGSIAVPRRRRRAKSDRIDGECLLRVLMAYKRGEPRVCSMVRPPACRRRTAGGSLGSARASWASAPSTPTESKACSSPRGSATTSRSGATAARNWRRCAPAMAGRCRII